MTKKSNIYECLYFGADLNKNPDLVNLNVERENQTQNTNPELQSQGKRGEHP